ncbi:unnamed protein product [Lactuca virosa]|uniref:Leucine-rich repeat-containing N-terminal plant-type domain-containing protein n=1 Tax=Lactuca virosa TaxID=75947 RepID=A0AAU9PIS8_9ASTR|nr:unnamed protein product [Lactuca virosa]
MAQYLNYFYLLQTISIVYVFVTVTCTRSSLSHDEECSALFQFKQSIIHEDDAACAMSGFQMFDSWKPTRNASNNGFECCSWDGVVCSKDDEYGHVIGLDLSERFICGHINSSSTLFRLVHLQRLNLAMNDFYESQIPSEIASLKQLRSLNLSGCGFSGQIPNEISQLVQLSSLDLSWNPLKLRSPSLKNLVQNLTGLEELHLSGVDINSSVPHFLANFSSFRSIMLEDCLLQDEFPVAIFELPKLKILSLASNSDLSGSFPEFRKKSLLEHVDLAFTGFFGTLPESIGNLNHLILLVLSGCSFSGRMPSSLSNMTQLTNLGLGSNNFTGFVPSLVSLSKLNSLELDDNKFEKERLPNWIGKLTKLDELSLANMNIHGEIPVFLANLTKLSVVSMGYNFLTGHMPSSFFNLTQLTQLVLYKNQLQGPISRSFSNFKSLQLLFLQYNEFSGRLDLDIFLGLNKLQNLNLGYNKISLVDNNNYSDSTLPNLKVLGLQSCNVKKFPAFLRFQNRMNGLFFAYNKIDGMVPIWIWNNSRETLQVINLSNNSITGFHQHPRFLPWERLEGFFIGNNQVRGQLPIPPKTTVFYDASDNNLTGEIPSLICEVKPLQLLDLSSNHMSGTLPPCLGSLSNSMLVFNLRRNNFHGTMMNEFMHGSMLKSIDLSENRFMGQLPRSLINCTNLEVLSLGENSFNDIFPSWLGTLAQLKVLVLRSNSFYGPIQGSINVGSQFSKLRIIDISNNDFNGQLQQKYFQTWNAMKSVYEGNSSVMASEISSALGTFHTNSSYSMTLIHKGVRTEYQKILTIFTAIDISSNYFEGEIPLSLQDLQGLESLNLSNNRFTGPILPSLGYLTNLESLDLSQNQLSGEIPHQLLQLGFLAIFNVSFNHLDGHIPQGKQFNTFENNSYEGNPRLCGLPLSKECQDSKVTRLPSASARNTSASLLPKETIDWIIIFCGVGSGLVVGIVIGNFLQTRCIDRIRKKTYG